MITIMIITQSSGGAVFRFAVMKIITILHQLQSVVPNKSYTYLHILDFPSPAPGLVAKMCFARYC